MKNYSWNLFSFQLVIEIYSVIFIKRKGDCKRMLNSQNPYRVGLCIHNSTACPAYASAILMKFLGYPQSGYELKKLRFDSPHTDKIFAHIAARALSDWLNSILTVFYWAFVKTVTIIATKALFSSLFFSILF